MELPPYRRAHSSYMFATSLALPRHAHSSSPRRPVGALPRNQAPEMRQRVIGTKIGALLSRDIRHRAA
eukprot:2160715-Pyramimonas_sp.AAC.1